MYIEESFDTIFNMGYASGKSPMLLRVNNNSIRNSVSEMLFLYIKNPEKYIYENLMAFDIYRVSKVLWIPSTFFHIYKKESEPILIHYMH